MTEGVVRSVAGSEQTGTARATRLLSMIGISASPDVLMRRTLAEVAEVLRSDVICVAEIIDDRLVLAGAHGVPVGDIAFGEVWPLGATARAAITSLAPVARDAVEPVDLPPSLSDRVGCAGGWIPLSIAAESTGDILIVLRDPGSPFSPADIDMLTFVGLRLSSALEVLERNAAIELLAKAAPDLVRHVDLASLLDAAVVLFRELTFTDSAFIATINDGVFELVSHTGTDESIPGRFPQTTVTMPNWDILSQGQPYVGPQETIRDRPDETNESPIVLSVPVVRDGVVIALLGATGHRPRSFGRTGVDIATIIASYLSAAMTNAELYRTLSEREQELEHQASHDPLTGLANRTTAGRRIEEALAGSPTGAVGLMFCDIDRFKAVNDRLGHEAGDELIQQVALRLTSAVRPQDLVARFGGDEFLVLFDAVRDLADLADSGRRLQVSLSDPIPLRGERLRVSASIGGVLGRTGMSAGVLLRNADAAMYVAKGKGTGRIEVFDDAASHHWMDRLDLHVELGHALERGQFSVVYQPLIELKNGAIRSFEALARWTHPERGEIAPDVFIPMAEETGAIVQIGEWVLAEASRQLVRWQRLFPRAGLTVGVNLSAPQLEPSQPDLLGIIEAAGADPHDIWLEVTERLDLSGDISDQVGRLRRAGVHFALDDFGISYSSLTYLQHFPVEGIKIDKTFVAPMTEDDTQRGIVRAILALGESLSVNVIAEGVETPEQLDALLDLGCVYGQGYLLAAPMTADGCVEALRAHS
jgi:diguanylate cyclase (GGDEF)-like protein